MRLMPASSAAWSKLVKLRVIPGSASDGALKAKFWPKNEVKTASAAPLQVLWPEMYSGKFGVTSRGVQDASGVVPGLPKPVSSWMAWIGRQVSKVYLTFQAAMTASPMAMFNSASSLAASASDNACDETSAVAIWFQCPGGV